MLKKLKIIYLIPSIFFSLLVNSEEVDIDNISSISFNSLPVNEKSLKENDYIDFIKSHIFSQPEYAFALAGENEKKYLLTSAVRSRFPTISGSIVNDEVLDRNVDDFTSIRKRQDDSFDAIAEIRQPILLTYNPPQIIKPREPLPVDLVLILGQVQSDNMLLVPESSTKRSASKNELLLSLSYHFPLGKIQKLFFKGLLKIDRQQDRSLASQEILFRQFGLDYQDRDLWGFSFTSGLGQNVISSKSDSVSSGSEGFVKTSESLFLFVSAENKFGKRRRES